MVAVKGLAVTMVLVLISTGWVAANGRITEPVQRAYSYCNRYGQTPIPRGGEPPGAARPAQPAGLRTHRRAPGGAPTGRRFPILRSVLLDGGRSCIPLRDSPGLSPGSLLRSASNVLRSMPTTSPLAWSADQLRLADYSVASASGMGRSPLLKSMVRRIVASSLSAAAATSATSSRETPAFSAASAPTAILPVAGSRVRRPGPSTVQSKSLARRWASAAAFASAYG